MTAAEQREAARKFIIKWQNKGKEDEDDRSFWLDIFQRILGVEDATDRMEFQKKVLVKGNTKRIDVYIPETKVLIEQKGLGKHLDKKFHNSGDIDLTPYDQAKRYDNNLPHDEKARWIVTSNFSEIWIYDMNKRDPEAEVVKINVSNLQDEFYRLEFLKKKEVVKISKEMQVSIKAGEIVGKLYDELYNSYVEKNEETLKSLNILCVRLVFCLYAEDAGLFKRKKMFHDYLIDIEPKQMRSALRNLFIILDTPINQREMDEDPELLDFPYVNGGLFSDETIKIPKFTEELKNTLLQSASDNFDWKQISPTIFGAIFESTLNPETRRSGGMHYTSIENIHKVIDPLFLNELNAEFESIKVKENVNGSRTKALQRFQLKLSKLKFLDPACGSGNFLTESYTSLRKLENKVLKELNQAVESAQLSFTVTEKIDIKVSIQQFYGIEVNDFAVSVAKTALWIAEAQMLYETLSFIDISDEFLPLDPYENIKEGNALRIDWNDVVPLTDLDYIMGNPPFIGQPRRTDSQSDDMNLIFGKGNVETKLDYVNCWYKKSLDYINEGIKGKIKVAYVSTNSICQGESVPTFWKLMVDNGAEIQFAHSTFIWDSEATDKAQVHVVIVGFTNAIIKADKKLYIGNNEIVTEHINGYLYPAPDIWITNRTNIPQNDLPKMTTGSPPTDDGGLLLTQEEKDILIDKYPILKKYIRPFIGAREFLHDKMNQLSRYCLWFANGNPTDYKNIKEIRERLEKCKTLRESSKADRIRKMADFPYLFCQNRQPDTNYLVIPRHSSQNRRYIPMGYMSPEIIAGDACTIVPNISIYHFGVLSSNVHNAWMRIVCGRLKSDFRYSPAIYNNFPWPIMTKESKANIEQTAQGILDARKLYFESSLSDLYDPLTMPPELQKAHKKNDIAVMKAYGFNIKEMSEADCVAELMKMYQKIIDKK